MILTKEGINRGVWVYDIETIKGIFTYIAYNIDTHTILRYVLHKSRNDLIPLLEHLYSCKGQIGFNNIGFDYPVIHYLLTDRKLRTLPVEEIISKLYAKAQDIIDRQNKTKNFEHVIREKDVKIRQLDLFKLWHYNNKARTQSLKGLEIAMCYPNVMEMPIHHSEENVSEDQIDPILDYNLNDVMATYKFYTLSLEKIGLRNDLNKTYDLNCANFPDSKIGERLILKLYCEATGLDIWEVNKMRSERLKIDLGGCIFDYIQFGTRTFNKLLSDFKGKTITETKGSVEESVIYKGFKYDFGLGGIHGCIRSGVYTSDDYYIIVDADVASLYPSIAILNGLFPAHLGPIFCKIYESILNQRITAKKAGNMVLSDGLKLALNAVYGKSNDKFSFLYDPLYTMTTTLNGQLMIAMLCESLVANISGLQMLQVNTDGITVRIPRSSLDLYKGICEQWEKDTKLTLEYVNYSKMVIRDVNNYLAITDNGKVKYKGAFEVDKVVGNEPAYHKDNSFRIIPYALKQYFVDGIPIEQTIKNHKNIYDFCGRQKFIGKDYGITKTIIGNEIVTQRQQKVTRYYISNKGSSFIKVYDKGSDEVINKGYLVTIFNKFEERENYDINYSFYIKECNKEIDLIINKQIELDIWNQ